MPTSVLALRNERLAVARTFIELSLIMRESIFTSEKLEGRANSGTLLLVACGVMVGHAERKPMNASKIADYVKLPRTVVRRSLNNLLALGVIVRNEKGYVVEPARAANQVSIVRRYIKAMERASHAMEKASHELLAASGQSGHHVR
jgi:hypothetical protein